jgi:cytochrome P450
VSGEFDLRFLPDSFFANPYPTYKALRESAPVHRLPDGCYFLTRYADLDRVYRDTVTFSSDKRIEFKPKFGDSPLYEHHTTSLVFNDPPLHTRVRKIISGALTPRAISGLEPALQTLIDRLLDRLAEKGTVDLVTDFAAAIPIEVIGNLLAVPHTDRQPLRGWSLAILSALEPAPSESVLAAGNKAVREFLAYLRELVSDRQRHPGDPAHDVLTRLIAGGQDGETLSEAELLHNCIFILNAGHETTTNLIGNALHLLIEWQDERRALLDEPTLIKAAIEEFLRFESSNQLGNRRVVVDARIGDIELPAGSLLTLCIGAANRDPAAFEEPDRLWLARQPNRHLAFISGHHQCVGMHLARLEAQVAVAKFLERFPRYRSAGDPVRAKRARFRGFVSLPVSLSVANV